MSDRYRERAGKVVAAFQAAIDAEVRERITKAEYEELTLWIQEAMAEAVGDAAEEMDAVLRRLRAEAEKPGLGM